MSSIALFVWAVGCHGQPNPSQEASVQGDTDVAWDTDTPSGDVTKPDVSGFDAGSTRADGVGDAWQNDAESDSPSNDSERVLLDAFDSLEDVGDSDPAGDSVDEMKDAMEDLGDEPTQPWTVESSLQPTPDVLKSVIAGGSFEEAYALAQGVWLRGAGGDVYVDPVKDLSTPVEGLSGEVLRVEVVGGETNVILTTAGLFAFNGDIVAPSPLASLIKDKPILDMVDASSNASVKLWLLTPSALYLYRDGDLMAFTSPDLDFSGGLLTYGATYNGKPACWIATANDTLYAAVEDGAEVLVWEVLENAPIDHLASDGEGNLWVRQADQFFRRSPEAIWNGYIFETPLVELSAHRSSWMAWFRLEKVLWGHAFGDFWKFSPDESPIFMRAGKKETLIAVESEQVVSYTVTSLPDPPVETVTWSNDIGPLSEQACGLCHGPGQFAHEMASYEQWVEEFTNILAMVETEQMPLAPGSPLTPVEKQLLLDWQLGGFLP